MSISPAPPCSVMSACKAGSSPAQNRQRCKGFCISAQKHEHAHPGTHSLTKAVFATAHRRQMFWGCSFLLHKSMSTHIQGHSHVQELADHLDHTINLMQIPLAPPCHATSAGDVLSLCVCGKSMSMHIQVHNHTSATSHSWY